MNCALVQEHLTAWVLNDLDPARAEAVTRHVETCPACRAEADSLRAAAGALREALAAQPEPPARLPDPARRKIRRVYDARRRAAGRARPVRLHILVRIAMAAGFVALLSGLLMPNLSSVRERARRVNDLANLNALYKTAVQWGLAPADSFRPAVPPNLEQVLEVGKLPRETTLNVSTRKPVEYYPEAAKKGGDMPLLVSPGLGGRNVVRVSGQGRWVEDGTPEARALDEKLDALRPGTFYSSALLETRTETEPGAPSSKSRFMDNGRTRPSREASGRVMDSTVRRITVGPPPPAAAPNATRIDVSPTPHEARTGDDDSGSIRVSGTFKEPQVLGAKDELERTEAARIRRLQGVREFQKKWSVSGGLDVRASKPAPPPPAAVPLPQRVDRPAGKGPVSRGLADAEPSKTKQAEMGQAMPKTPAQASELHDRAGANADKREDSKKTADYAPPAQPGSEPKTPESEEAPPAGPPDAGPPPRASGVHPFVAAADAPCSTFSIDVDTASYTHARQYLLRGRLPPPESVRTEEFVNYFDYAYPPPARGPFAVHTECGPTPFGRGLALLKIGVKARRLGREEQRPLRLTLLVDTSGSMATPDRMGLLKDALGRMLERLDPADQVALVHFDTQARLVLESTPAAESSRIRAALDGLQPSGSTSLEAGMRAAYEVAARAFDGGAFNRVLLLTDGMANLGAADAEPILASVESYRKQGITLSVFGVGFGSYNDALLETLAGKGDGQYAFLDSRAEAGRVLADELAASAAVIARDVKIQVEFDPGRVGHYRQIGYENRALAREQFRDDTVDAGEIGSGQSVTALYELDLHGAPDAPLGVVRVRCRVEQTGRIEELDQPVPGPARGARFEAMDARFRLAAAAAEFAELLRGSPHAAGSRFEDVSRVLYPVAAELALDARIADLLRLNQTGLNPVFRDAEPPTERTSP